MHRLIFGTLVALAGLAGASCSVTGPSVTGDPLPGELPSWTGYAATAVLDIDQPDGARWLLPSAAVPAGEAIFVLDTGNNQVLKLDEEGRHLATFDSFTDPHLQLNFPTAMATDGDRLAIANSEAAELVVIDLVGSVQQSIALPSTGPSGRPARPIGVVFLQDGGFAVSDADNHMVLILDARGQLIRTVGSGIRADGRDGFNVPGPLAVDAEGNIYVVDTLNARIVQLSPDGKFLGQFSERGANVGSLSRPKGVAVDPDGRVFVSDGLLAAVQVFGADGEYLGLIGRRDTPIPGTESPFRAPAGLWLAEGQLYVMDRFAGLLIFSLPEGG